MEEEIELRQYWEVLRKRWIIVVALPLIAALTSGIISFFVMKPVYSASTTLIVGKKASESGQAAVQMLDNSVLQANLQLAKTYAAIAQSRTVEQNVIKDLDLSMTIAQLDNMISINPVKTTEILEIQVLNTDPELAASIANSMANEFSKAVIDIKKVDSVSIVDTAMTPTHPVKPNKKLNVLIAFVVGLMASVGLVFLLEYIDNTIKTSDDVEKFLGIPVLGVIPNYEVGKQG
ncbi:YveK family protein [Desulfosporosinus sp. BICA1-9]|uniref:YveK family protein n=1 Tax=Desulfosporosinus sp. BICA1-9 TaxID=1531958 RepID=UPI00054BCD7D|nr:Wzz/FepE/Etk N-terminal domain-containing protein [Desulfosporosinus sp. BICA1-9]KJS50336.1 MAG: lipopolysaccharide biosynthesis protein [Peptococcaceae bacterium BRH_c23]KJS88624.1 MAG: lipopolysaccharide biosynthesis protein [Desulfosporosinus sp. BICA1-9]HBW35483.1 lipopolysaccharide biosynthesis protein [Desulfosporosinus sp.]